MPGAGSSAGENEYQPENTGHAGRVPYFLAVLPLGEEVRSGGGRDEFQRMLRDAENGRFDCLLVWEIDRFGRERQDIPTGKMTLKRAGVKPHIDLLQYQRKRTALACSSAVQMVELRGVEPLSERTLTGLSPGAVRFQHSLPAKTPDRLCSSVES